MDINQAFQDAAETDRSYLRTGRELVAESLAVIRDRRKKYGNDVLPFFSRVADLWTSYLNYEVSAEDVAALMILLKIIRHDLAINPDDDDLADIIGYTAVWKDIEVQRAS